jgi:hypothetical protein
MGELLAILGIVFGSLTMLWLLAQTEGRRNEENGSGSSFTPNR